VTTRQVLEFSDDPAVAVEAVAGISGGVGWCNLTPEIEADEVEVLSPSVFSLRTKQGAPVASLVTSPPKRGVARPSSLGVLHTRGRLGKERVTQLLAGAPFMLRQDHQTRGLLFEVPPDAPAAEVVATMCRLLETLCDYDRTGRWRLEVFERTVRP
jgi:hypothetical protein